jgi:hypothetical protein
MARTGTVWCHRCPDTHYEDGVLVSPGDHDAATTTLIGSPAYGALWHCPEHNDCPDCPRGSWSDPWTPRRHGWPRLPRKDAPMTR